MLRTSYASPSRLITKTLFSRRKTARGPAEVGAFLSDRQLHGMFEHIGTTYDFQNHILSAGQDIHWRHVLGDMVRPRDGEHVCDMATGTGDVAIELVRRNPSIRVTGVDYSEGMLAVAARKLDRRRIDQVQLVHGDIRNSPVLSGSADVLTISFALRNIPDRASVLAEFKRVLRPGGRLFIMDFTLPTNRVVKFFYGLYFDHVMPLVGNVLSRTDYAYSYLRESVRAFPTPERFVSEIEAAGFRKGRVQLLSYGLAAVYYAENKDGSE